jgi:hypothetical protein
MPGNPRAIAITNREPRAELLQARRCYDLLNNGSTMMSAMDFLDYDPSCLDDCYKDEPRANTLLYTELDRFLGNTWTGLVSAANSLRVSKLAEPFDLVPSDPNANALAQFTKEKKLDHDDPVVRLVTYDSQEKHIVVQRCAYSDGLRSNYAVDLNSPNSLRAVLQAQYGSRLPPLSDKRLSNAIGVAAVLFHKGEHGGILPYLPKRSGAAKQQAVFPEGGYHCTASGETIWNDAATSFAEVFTQNICRELHEEVGVEPHDLEWIYPVAFCREFLRAGKPQLFFAGFTKLPPREIANRGRAAIRKQIANGRQEVEDDTLIVETPEQLCAELRSHGTIEAIANMTYAQDCAVLAHEANKFR